MWMNSVSGLAPPLPPLPQTEHRFLTQYTLQAYRAAEGEAVAGAVEGGGLFDVGWGNSGQLFSG